MPITEDSKYVDRNEAAAIISKNSGRENNPVSPDQIKNIAVLKQAKNRITVEGRGRGGRVTKYLRSAVEEVRVKEHNFPKYHAPQPAQQES